MMLEARLTRQMTPIWRGMLHRFRSVYRTTGTIVDLSEFSADWAGIIRSHEARTIKVFGGIAAGWIGIDLDQEVIDLRDMTIAEALAGRAERRGALIVGTSQRQLQSAVIAAEASEQVRKLGHRKAILSAIAVLGGVMAYRAWVSRSAAIANGETQIIAEGTKWAEIEAINRSAGQGPGQSGQNPNRFKKVWNSALKETTRPAHAAAHGQAVNIDGTFTVGGQSLRFPADTALGATLDNVINCLCWVDYFDSGEFVTDTPRRRSERN